MVSSSLFESSLELDRIPTIVHGFFARSGGASVGPYASLNCSFNVDDHHEMVAHNQKLAMDALNLFSHKLLVPKLCHGDDSVIVEEDDGDRPADAIITSSKNYALGVTYADCLPILIAEQHGEVVAAVHAGWRGVKLNIIAKTLERIQKRFGKLCLTAALGPAISPESFFVRDEAYEFFKQHWPAHCHFSFGGAHVDLVAIAIQQLKNSSISVIEKVGGYTDLDARYFSYRRDGKTTGRQIAIIAKT